MMAAVECCVASCRRCSATDPRAVGIRASVRCRQSRRTARSEAGLRPGPVNGEREEPRERTMRCGLSAEPDRGSSGAGAGAARSKPAARAVNLSWVSNQRVRLDAPGSACAGAHSSVEFRLERRRGGLGRRCLPSSRRGSSQWPSRPSGRCITSRAWEDEDGRTDRAGRHRRMLP